MKTKSEGLFEGFLATNNLPFEKIEEEDTPRPDYRVSVCGCVIIFEIKELVEDSNFGVVKDPAYPHIKSSSRTLGAISGGGSNGQRSKSNSGPNKEFPRFF